MDVPVSASEYLVVSRDPLPEDDTISKSLLKYQKIVYSHYNYKYPEVQTKRYKREDFQLPETAFVMVVVGNRLDFEMDDAFLQMVGKLMETNEDAYFMIIGKVQNKVKIEKNIKDTKRIRYAGYVPASGECVRITDVYLNPRRVGGGRSAFEALHYGVPVITLRYGDVNGACGEEFAVEDYTEMHQQLERYMRDAEYLQEMKERAEKRAHILMDMEGTFRKLFNDLGIYI